MKTDIKCALMDCDLIGYESSLGKILETYSKDTMIYHQAKILIEKHGFKKEDILCEDCFWK